MRISLAIVFLVACHSSAPATAWTVAAGAVCAPDGGAIVLAAGNPATITDAKGAVQTPKVELVLSGVTQPATAVPTNGGEFTVTLPPNSATGTYDLVVTRASDGAVEHLTSAVQVLGPPVITAISGQAACSNAATQSFTVTGSNFGPKTSVTLAGDAAPLVSSTDPAGATITVTAPIAGHTAATGYTIAVSNGGGSCVVTSSAADGFVVKAPPTATAAIAGPHLHSGKLAQSAAVVVRVTGTNLASGTAIKVGTVTAGTVVASGDGTSADATFAAGALAAGDAQVIAVANGACVAPALAATLDVGAADMTVNRLSPTGWVAGQQGVFFDAFGTLSQATQLWIDTDASVFTEQWTAVPLFTKLDAAGNAQRFATASGAAPVSTSGPTNVSLTSADGTHEAFVAGGLTLSPAAAPRIVWKSKEWLNAGGDPGDTLIVYGCDIADAHWKLVATQGNTVVDVPNGALTSATASASEATWGGNKFKCINASTGGDVPQAVVLTGHSLARGGPYRIRAFFPASAGAAEVDDDDLYPLMVYDTTNLTLSAGTQTVPPMIRPRKNPNTLTAGDATGRKYLYVIGGAYNDGLTDPSEGAGDAYYEYSPLDPEHGLVGWVPDTASAPDPFSLEGDDHAASYGMATSSDGTLLYFAGGATTSTAAACTLVTNCNATAGVRIAKVADPTAGSPTAGDPPGSLSALGSPNDGLGTATSLCHGSGTCATSTSNGDHRYGAKSVLVSDGTTRKLLVFGGYTSAGVLAGAANNNLLYAISVDASGLVRNSGSDDITPSAGVVPQAPQSLVFVPSSTAGSVGTLYAVLGVDDGTNESQTTQVINITEFSGACAANCGCDTQWQYCAGVGVTASGSGLNPSTCESTSVATCNGTSPCSQTGFSSADFGTSLLSLGGTSRQCEMNPTKWTGPSQPNSSNLKIALSTGTVSTVSSLPNLSRERTLAGSAMMSPFVALIAGVQCIDPASCNTDSSDRTAVRTVEITQVH